MSMTAKFVVMEDLPCMPYGDQSIPVRIAFFLYDICNMLHRIVQPLQRATLLQTAAEPSAMANRPSVLNASKPCSASNVMAPDVHANMD